ncbi:MAG: hypothetical protein HZA34_01785 [Candidatus Pacebacteria bacterium]|nr:hypothetical protein [Candidatus Paceibacterota bacterium]
MEPLYTKIFGIIQRFVLLNKLHIVRLLFFTEILLVLFACSGVVAVTQNNLLIPVLALIGKKLGTLSVVLLCFVVIPGIFRRLQCFTIVRVTVMSIRRHLGILMYLTGVIHSLFTYWMPRFIFGPTPLQYFQIFGMVTLSLGFPLFLTSNDFSVKLLKKMWDVLHKGVYIMLFFVSLHLLFLGNGLGIIVFILVIMECVSYLYSTRHHDHTITR